MHWVSSSRTLSRDGRVHRLYGSPCTPRLRSARQLSRLKQQYPELVVLGWGFRPSTHKARHWAEQQQLPFWQLEEGFLAYLGHPALNDRRFSLILDKTGIYYDARQPSDLDILLETTELASWQHHRINAILNQLVTGHISKYNHRPTNTAEPHAKPHILLVDQTIGDASITGALASAHSFEQLLKTAATDNPGQTLWLKAHPDVLLGKKRGYLFEQRQRYPQLQILPQDLPPAQILANCSKLYTVSSQLGFEALWQQQQGRYIEVHCFGMPFYAGRGLTTDYCAPLHPRKACDLQTLCYAALLQYTRYIDPETEQPCELESLLPLLAEQTRQRPQYTAIYAIGFSFWKRLFLPCWLRPMAQRHHFRHHNPKRLTDNEALLLWGNKPVNTGQQVLRVEDGFIRSRGLGIDLHPPLSLIFDTQGIYFDATRPSDLEILLQTADLTDEQCQRAARLRQQIVTHNISKYNLNQPVTTHAANAAQQRILVIGQVDNDASIRFGTTSQFPTILSVLQQVRADYPKAQIIYRPHPDVLTGERKGLLPAQAATWIDTADTGTDIGHSLHMADEVHVLSSLAGFEALLRGKTVVCYGLPFYAGWGLTTDKTVCERRNRRRSLDELVYLALIQYPRYLHPQTRRYTTAERLICYLRNNNSRTIPTGRGYTARLLQKIRLLMQQLKN